MQGRLGNRMARWLILLLLVHPGTQAVRGDDARPAAEAPAETKVDLVGEQRAILRDFNSFEKRLAEIGEGLRGTDLDRANLLSQARSEIQRNQINTRMDEIVAILAEQRPYADAVERQKAVIAHLEEILRILQTDAERDRLQTRIKELEEILKNTNRVIAAQKDVRADTERGGDFKDLEAKEQDVLRGAGELADSIDQQDARREGREGKSEIPADAESRQPDSSDPEGKSSDETPMDGKSPKGDSPDDEPKEGDSKEGQPMSDQPMEGASPPSPSSEEQPQDGQPQDGKPQDGPPQEGSQDGSSQPPQQQQDQSSQQQQTPGRQQLEQARQEMQQALDELRKENRDKASNEQDQAIAKLEEMKAQIEEILRQLREEEKEIHLTMLEARFQEMLKRQLRINADTVRLDARDEAERGEAHFTKSRDLSRQQRENIIAAEKALLILKEEGSSVAFPEAVDQMRSNMANVGDRLFKGDTGSTVQLMERMIVESLEEMIASLQQELEKMQEQNQQQQQQQQGQPQEPGLVDQLAELKLIRSLQNQVNRLTRQIGTEVDGEQTTDPDTVQLLRDLSGRQQRIQEATYDLATGRNQ